jgi:very-short-patch-repair endonuclease
VLERHAIALRDVGDDHGVPLTRGSAGTAPPDTAVRDAPVVPVVGWPEVFRGSRAVAAGLTTWSRLRGPRFQRLFPDVYAPAGEVPDPFRRLSLAAARLVGERGVLSGYSAAELLGARCAPRGAPAEVTLLDGGRFREHPGLLVHRDRITAGERVRVGEVGVTHPVRTAWDLARRLDLVDAVVAVDRLADHCRFNPDLVLDFPVHHPRARGNNRVYEVLAQAERYSGSPMETRLRMLLVLAGLPRPRAQWVVQDPVARTAVWLDLAHPELRIGIEYDGEDHTTPGRVLRDIGRSTRLLARDWLVYRYTEHEIREQPELIVEEVTRARERRAIALTPPSGSDGVPLTGARPAATLRGEWRGRPRPRP